MRKVRLKYIINIEVHFGGYLYIMELINVWKMEHRMYTKLIWLQIGTSAGHMNIQLNLHVPNKAENISFS